MEIKVREISDEYSEVIIKCDGTIMNLGFLNLEERVNLSLEMLEAVWSLCSDDEGKDALNNLVSSLSDKE